jgi:hypothetical protein
MKVYREMQNCYILEGQVVRVILSLLDFHWLLILQVVQKDLDLLFLQVHQVDQVDQSVIKFNMFLIKKNNV